jgi:hypothetical protein
VSEGAIAAAQTVFLDIEHADSGPAQNTALPEIPITTMVHSKIGPLSPSQLREILNVYRICFEAAVDAERKPSVTGLSQHPRNERTWRVYQNYKTSWEAPYGAASEAFVAAYKKWALCDNFCVMAYGALKEHLESMFVQALLFRAYPT